MRTLFVVFIVLHGLVHLLYFGQSAQYFKLKPGMGWPDEAWVFSKFLGDEAVRKLVSLSMLLTAVGLVVGGIGILVSQAWWRPAVVSAATFSSMIFFLAWNGRMQSLDGQGFIGILINIAILIAVVLFRLPQLGF